MGFIYNKATIPKAHKHTAISGDGGALDDTATLVDSLTAETFTNTKIMMLSGAST